MHSLAQQDLGWHLQGAWGQLPLALRVAHRACWEWPAICTLLPVVLTSCPQLLWCCWAGSSSLAGQGSHTWRQPLIAPRGCCPGRVEKQQGAPWGLAHSIPMTPRARRLRTRGPLGSASDSGWRRSWGGQGQACRKTATTAPSACVQPGEPQELKCSRAWLGCWQQAATWARDLRMPSPAAGVTAGLQAGLGSGVNTQLCSHI